MTDINDMLKTIVPKSSQLNADDLIGGSTLTIKVTKVSIAAGDQPVALSFENDGGKPYMPGKSMRRVMVNVWGSDANKYIGRSMTLYCDPKVLFGGVAVGGIRISHMSHIDKDVTMALTANRANRKPFTVKPLTLTTIHTPDTALIDAAKLEAARGTDALKAHWGKLTPAHQKSLNLAELKEIAAISDSHKTPEPPTEGCSDNDSPTTTETDEPAI